MKITDQAASTIPLSAGKPKSSQRAQTQPQLQNPGEEMMWVRKQEEPISPPKNAPSAVVLGYVTKRMFILFPSVETS